MLLSLAVRVISHNVYGNYLPLSKVWAKSDIDRIKDEETILALQEVHEQDLKQLLQDQDLDPDYKNYGYGVQQNEELIVSWLNDFIQLPTRNNKARAGNLFLVNILPRKFFEVNTPHEPRISIFSNSHSPYLGQPFLEKMTKIKENMPAAMWLALRTKANKCFNFVNCHLTAFTSAEKRRQTLRYIFRVLKEYQLMGKTILAGDFNPLFKYTCCEEQRLNKFLNDYGFQSQFLNHPDTYTNYFEGHKLDVIAIPKDSSFEFTDYQVHPDSRGSDHKIVEAEIELKNT